MSDSSSLSQYQDGPAHRRRNAFKCFWLLLFTVAATACGYGFVGTGDLPGGIETIAVNVLENRTGETGLEIAVTNALIDELTRRHQNMVVDQADAGATLSGTIDSLSASTITRTSLLNASERRLVIVASLTLKSADGTLLWEKSNLRVEQDYAVRDINAETNAERRAAIYQAAQRLAEYVYERLTDSF